MRDDVEGASVSRVVAVENHKWPGDNKKGRRRQKTTNTMRQSSEKRRTHSNNTTTTPNVQTNKTKTGNNKRIQPTEAEKFLESVGRLLDNSNYNNKYKDKQPTATKVRNPNRQPGPENRSAGRFPDSGLT